MDLIEKIKNLNNNEKSVVLNFLKNKNIRFSKNNNGYFFNLKNENNIEKELNNLIENIQNNRNLVSNYLKQRKIEQEKLKLQIEEEFNKKKLEETKNIYEKLSLKKEDINILINPIKIKSTKTESEWNQYMNKLENLKVKHGLYYRLSKIIKKKHKSQPKDDAEDYSQVLEEENEEHLETEPEEILESGEDVENNIETDSEEILETEEESLDDEVEQEEESEEKEKNYNDNLLEQQKQELIKKIKEKLISKGQIFNMNMDCKLVIENYIR